MSGRNLVRVENPSQTKPPLAIYRAQFTKSTKNKHRFDEVDAAGDIVHDPYRAAFKTFYIDKSEMKDPPQFITITVT